MFALSESGGRILTVAYTVEISSSDITLSNHTRKRVPEQSTRIDVGLPFGARTAAFHAKPKRPGGFLIRTNFAAPPPNTITTVAAHLLRQPVTSTTGTTKTLKTSHCDHLRLLNKRLTEYGEAPSLLIAPLLPKR